MRRRHTANDYAITCEIEVDDRTGAFVRLIRAWGVDPAYKPDEPELPVTAEREEYARNAWTARLRHIPWSEA